MKKTLTFLSFLFFIFTIIANVYSQDKSQKIDELINKYFEYGQFNGSALVSENGKVILSKGYGLAEMEWNIPNTPDTKFRLGSITKQFTSMLIMQLVEEGKISLDANISDYLPYYRKDTGGKVTIRNLLTHTSGIPNYTNDPEVMRNTVRNTYTVKELVEKLCSGDLEFEPGSEYSYSNSGYVILGAVIEEVTGKKYEQVLSENILIPLEMSNTGYDHASELIKNRASGYDKSPYGYTNARYIDMSIPFSAGSLYSTVNDLFKWDQALYTDKLLSNSNKVKMLTPFLKNYGFGWKITEVEIGDLKKKLITHSGGIFGFNTEILRYTEDNNCIILLNNFSTGNLDEMSKNISSILYDQKYDMPKMLFTEVLINTIKEKGFKDALKEFSDTKAIKNMYNVNESEINNLGYGLMSSNKTDEAIEIFKLNTELFPNSSNVFDSLGEAYRKNGNTELAIQNYKKSVELDPKSESGKKALSELMSK